MMKQSYIKRLSLLFLCSCGIGAYGNVPDTENLESAIRGSHKDRDHDDRRESKKITGIIQLFSDDETDSFLPRVLQGKGFNLHDPVADQRTATENYSDIGLSKVCFGSACNTNPCDIGPFAVRQVLGSGRIQFECKCKNLPVVLTGVRADEDNAFDRIGYLGDKVVINSIDVQVRQVDETGFTFDIIVIVYGANDFVINDALDLLLPQIGFSFAAIC